VRSLISSSSSCSSDTVVPPLAVLLLLNMEPWLAPEVRLKLPRLGITARWLAGLTVMIRFELLATIISVTYTGGVVYKPV